MDVLKETFSRILDGRASHELYNTYSSMVRRCYDQDFHSYKNYGAKGVKISEDWLGENGIWQFISDIGERPPGLTLDRIDPFGNYCKENCRWATLKIQANNTRMDLVNNTTGIPGVHWCKRDKALIVQINLMGKRVVIGRFSPEDWEQAASLYLDVKQLKLKQIPDEQIYQDYVLLQRVGTKKAKQRRNKTSTYWGVSYKASTDQWLAYTDRYLGVFKTEELANDCVQKWLQNNVED